MGCDPQHRGQEASVQVFFVEGTSSSSLAAAGAEELTDSLRRRFHPSRSLAETVIYLFI